MLNYYRNKVLRKGLDFEKKQVFRKMSFIKPVSLYLQKNESFVLLCYNSYNRQLIMNKDYEKIKFKEINFGRDIRTMEQNF